MTFVLAAIAFALASQRFVITDSSGAVRQGRASVSADKRLTRSVLVSSQIAFATVILVATSLLGQTFYKLANADLGFTPKNVLTMRTELPRSEISPYKTFAARDSFYRRVLAAVQQVPGVVSASYTTYLPLTNRYGGMGIIQEGVAPPAPGQWNDAMVRVVIPGYFKAIGLRLIAGRFLSERDGISQPPAAVISEAMSRKYWPGLNPIGRRFRFDDPNLPYFTVIVVLADSHFQSIEAAPLPMVYLSSLQDLPIEAVFYPRDLAIPTTGDPATYIAAVRQCIWSVDSEQAISSVQTLSAVVDDRLASYKLEAELFTWFAVGAILLSSIGVYGLLSYDVANRTREIGLRMALGAERRDVIGRVVRSAIGLALIGLVAGCVFSFTLVGVLRSLLYGVAGWDVSSRVVAIVIILAAVLVAAYLPARRASAIDPMTALRGD